MKSWLHVFANIKLSEKAKYPFDTSIFDYWIFYSEMHAWFLSDIMIPQSLKSFIFDLFFHKNFPQKPGGTILENLRQCSSWTIVFPFLFSHESFYMQCFSDSEIININFSQDKRIPLIWTSLWTSLSILLEWFWQDSYSWENLILNLHFPGPNKL